MHNEITRRGTLSLLEEELRGIELQLTSLGHEISDRTSFLTGPVFEGKGEDVLPMAKKYDELLRRGRKLHARLIELNPQL